MGLAASQARLLSLTARIHDVEYQAQMIQNAKLQLATQEDEVYRKYNEALDATTLTYNTGTATIPANFNNLCGIASISNGMNKCYAFRTGNDKTTTGDRLIVPNDVFEGFVEYGGEDPYEFAMFMLGVTTTDISRSEEEYLDNMINSGLQGNLKTLKESMDEQLKVIAEKLGYDPEDLKRDITEGQSIEGVATEEVQNLIDDYKKTEEEFRYKMYSKSNGAENIYKAATGEDNFDYSQYQYYLRWGMLILKEEGIEGCVKASDYGENFENDGNALKGMLESGRIAIETVAFDGKGGVVDSTTSVGADSSVQYTTTSTINKKELAKAEAEYEHAMKQIDRKDKKYDMDLNRLETERTALTTEYDSVKKVIQDNIERTFKIFS